MAESRGEPRQRHLSYLGSPQKAQICWRRDVKTLTNAERLGGESGAEPVRRITIVARNRDDATVVRGSLGFLLQRPPRDRTCLAL